jgi:hypothetical protein
MPQTKGKNKDGGNVGGHLMDLAENGPEDAITTPAEKEASVIQPAPSGTDSGTDLATPIEKEDTTIPQT